MRFAGVAEHSTSAGEANRPLVRSGYSRRGLQKLLLRDCDVQVATNWSPAERSFERLEENAGGVPDEEFPVPDVAGEHGVGGMPCLLPDLERGDARPSRAGREAGAKAMA
jgi:hypothetical protein